MKLNKSTRKLLSQLIVEGLFPLKYVVRDLTNNNWQYQPVNWVNAWTDGNTIYKEDKLVPSGSICSNREVANKNLWGSLQTYIRIEHPNCELYDLRLIHPIPSTGGNAREVKLNRKHPWMKGVR
jgi:hypothetical protein